MKVLIVDDESHVRDAVRLLVDWDAQGIDNCLTAESTDEAQEILDAEKPEIAIVDVVIGDNFGMQVAEYVQDKCLPTKIIAISGHDDFQYVRSMFVLGCVEYLLKPIEPEPLIKAVEKGIAAFREEQQIQEEEPDNSEELASNGKLMQQVVDYLTASYGQRIRQQDVADKFFLNREYLSRAFKKYTGTGMAKFLNDLRIREAQNLLLNTDLQIQEIADRVGYFDSKYFSQQFRKLVGMSPNQFRQGKEKD